MEKGNRLGPLPYLNPIVSKLLVLVLCALSPVLWADPAWKGSLEARIAQIDTDYPGELGVYVEDLATGESFGWRADEFWYLASAVKVPVAISVMQAVDRGDLALDTKVTLVKTDFVDGAGSTNWYSPGDKVTVHYLMEQMLVYSDNTATDALIRTVGLDTVNSLVKHVAPEGVGAITTLSDVRRYAYSAFHERASDLTSADLFTIKKAAGEQARIDTLANIMGVERLDFKVETLKQAFDSYYDLHLNSGRLNAFPEVFDALLNDTLLRPDSRDYLLSLLEGIKTGERRIKAGLPDGVRFFHKTGTQYGRACNMGIAVAGEDVERREIIIAACGRGTTHLAASESALRQIGEAVAVSGIFVSLPSTLGDATR